MSSARGDAWAELHAATPPGWYVGRPGQRHGGQWAIYAFDTTERAHIGKRGREWTAIAECEEALVRETARCLRKLREGRTPKEPASSRRNDVGEPVVGGPRRDHAVPRTPFRSATDGVSCDEARTLQAATVMVPHLDLRALPLPSFVNRPTHARGSRPGLPLVLALLHFLHDRILHGREVPQTLTQRRKLRSEFRHPRIVRGQAALLELQRRQPVQVAQDRPVRPS